MVIISSFEITVLCKEAIRTFISLKYGLGLFIDKATNNHIFSLEFRRHFSNIDYPERLLMSLDRIFDIVRTISLVSL